MAHYHIITYHPVENGFDDKSDHETYSEAKVAAKRLLTKDNPDFRYVEKVFILHETKPFAKLMRVYDKDNRNGRRPFGIEKQDFNFTVI